MQSFFRKRLFQKRFIALAAAYAIALSGLIANFGGAQMAAAGAAQPGSIICHTDVLDDTAPSPDGGANTGKACVEDCCTGCLMHAAALPPPPAIAIELASSAGERIAPLPVVAFIASPQNKSHRTRAPPLTA